MASKKREFTLQFGRDVPFRRTINTGTDKKPVPTLLVFERDKYIELSEKEIAQLDREIQSGVIEEVNLDPKGRHRARREVLVAGDAEAKITSLENQLADAKAENAELRALIAEYEGEDDELTDGGEDDATAVTEE